MHYKTACDLAIDFVIAIRRECSDLRATRYHDGIVVRLPDGRKLGISIVPKNGISHFQCVDDQRRAYTLGSAWYPYTCIPELVAVVAGTATPEECST